MDCAEVARAEARSDEELATRGGVAAGDVKRGARKDGHAAAVDAKGGVAAEPEDALLDAPGGQARIGGSAQGMDAHARLDDEAVTKDASGVGGVLVSFNPQGARGVDTEAARLPVAVTAQVDGERAFVDVSRAGDVVCLNWDGQETLETGAQFFDGELIAEVRADEATEGKVITQLGIDHQACVGGRSRHIEVLNDR